MSENEAGPVDRHGDADKSQTGSNTGMLETDIPNQPQRNCRINRPGRLFVIAVGMLNIVKTKNVPM